MPLVRVGYRRLYDAIGCSLGDDQRELSFTFSFSPDLDVAIYLGPKPTFGINICRSDKYLVPGEESTLLKGEYYRDASKSNYPRNVFVEIFVSKYVEVSEGTMIALHVRDQQTQNELLKLAEKDADTVCRTADLVAGIIGLRFHRQFVIEVLNENFVAFYSDKDFVHKVEGPPV